MSGTNGAGGPGGVYGLPNAEERAFIEGAVAPLGERYRRADRLRGPVWDFTPHATRLAAAGASRSRGSITDGDGTTASRAIRASSTS
jgi:hypothetical protein